VCQLRYWSLPTRESDAWVNGTSLLRDVVTPENTAPSVVDCSENPVEDCLDRAAQLDRDLPGRTFGLTPEDPIIMHSRMDYPLGSVVALTPLMWQTRAKRVPCSGFGDRYNSEVLGAGKCTADQPCDPKRVTQYRSKVPSKRTGRTQSIYLTYSEDALFCVDRSEQEETFKDKSWSPWASYEELTEGREMNAVDFGGDKVFYKFVPSMDYTEAPVVGESPLRENECDFPAGTPPCRLGDEGCSDPLTQPNHPMWNNSANSYSEDCTLRKRWTERYLSIARSNWGKDRRSTWWTMETSSLNLALLVITPQSEDYADIVTLVKITFDVSQTGQLKASVKMSSTSQTSTLWFVLGGVVIFFALAYGIMSFATYPGNRRKLRKAWDCLITLCCTIHVVANIAVELGPPHVQDDLLAAFAANQQGEYFDTYKAIIEYNEVLLQMKYFGFFVALVMFVRFTLHLLLHPRLSLLTRTLEHCMADLLHFAVYLLAIQGFLAAFAVWAFGDRMERYHSFTEALWTQAKMFTGSVGYPARAPDLLYLMYLAVAVFVVVMLMLNFMFAILLGAYSQVVIAIKKDHSMASFLDDILDAYCSHKYAKRNHWPDRLEVFHHLTKDDTWDDEGMVAVTKQELESLICDRTTKPMFQSPQVAENFISYYAAKLDGYMVETDPELLVRDVNCEERSSLGGLPGLEPRSAEVTSLDVNDPVNKERDIPQQGEI